MMGARFWKHVKFFSLVVGASLLGVILAGYPSSPKDSFLGSLVAGQSTYQKAKLVLHRRWRPYNPLRVKKQHIEGGQQPGVSE